MIQTGEILSNRPISKDIYEMTLRAPNIAAAAKPGQFVNLRLFNTSDPLLRRPISLCDFDAETGIITLWYMIVGRGTAMMTKKACGDTIDILGPLGNGWTLDFEGNKAVIVGGGIGTAPMFPLAVELVKKGKSVLLIAGAKTKDSLLPFDKYEDLNIEIQLATDDGSFGHHGFVTDLLSKAIDEGKCDYLYACGPLPMLRNVEKTALVAQVSGEVSTESHMGCGLGVCLGCPSKMKDGSYKRTCTDGPVFAIGELSYE